MNDVAPDGVYTAEMGERVRAMQAPRCQSILVLGPDLKVQCEAVGDHDKHGVASMRFVEFDSGSFVPTTLIWFT